MKKYQSPSGYFELEMPYSWDFSEDETNTSFYDEANGAGALQISSFLIDKDQTINIVDELAEMVSDSITLPKQNIINKIITSTNSASINFIREDRYWEYHMLYKNYKLLFITYNCKEVDYSLEKKIVDKIIQSIKQ